MKKCLITAIVITALLSGCDSQSTRTVGGRETPQTGKISKLELREELDRFEYMFVTAMKQTAAQIDSEVQTRRVQRTNLQMRTRIIEALHAMTAADDPIAAFLDTWSLIIRLRNYLETGDGRRLYGEQQPTVVAFIKMAEMELNRIGQLFLNPDQFEYTQQGLENFALQHPVIGTYSNLVVYATQEEVEEAGVLMQTLRIPMAPIRALEGVDKTGDAIMRVHDSVERFTDVAQQLPESTRWQMSILMDDFEESQMTQTFLTSLNEFSQSSARLVEVLETMPAQLRSELLTVLEESGESQQQLQTTMRTTAEAAVQLEKTLGEFQKASLAVNETTVGATEAAKAWKDASDSIQELVMLFKTKTPRSPDAPPAFGMRDFDNMLLNAGQTADKISGTLSQLQQTVDQSSETVIRKELRSLVDVITWRLVWLILLFFALLFVYHYTGRAKKT